MRKSHSVASLEMFGAVRLSMLFYMRDFHYSEIASMYGLANNPDDPRQAIQAAATFFQGLLEPFNEPFGRISISSGDCSLEANSIGNERKHNSSLSEPISSAGCIFDHADADGRLDSPSRA